MINRSRLARFGIALGLSVAGVLAVPAPGFAHGVGGLTPTNYRTTLTPGTPGVPGVRVEVIDVGERIAVTNTGADEIIVVGYQGEPYLRIGPTGTFTNLRSPATYLNATNTPTGPPPESADPALAPEWKQISTAPTARWHDHRAHWMGPQPAIVRDDPHRTHVLTTWDIPLRRAGADIPAIRGDIRWISPISPWPWVIGAIALAIGIAVTSRLRVARGIWMSALAVAAVTEITVFASSALYAETSVLQRISAGAYNIFGAILAAVAFIAVIRKRIRGAAPLVLIAGLVIFLGTGLPGFKELSASQLPTVLPTAPARVLIMLAIGLGLGLIGGAAQFLRVSAVRSSTEPPRGPTGDDATNVAHQGGPALQPPQPA